MRIDVVTYFENADKVLRGLTALEAELGLAHCTKASYEPLLLEAKARCAAFNQERAGKAGAYNALRKARPGAVKFLRDVRNHLSGPLGNKFSALWEPLGFLRSLRLPRTDAGRCQMLERMKRYFTRNPLRECAAEDYTAAQAEQWCASLKSAATGVEDCKYNLRTEKDARRSALKSLDKKLGALRHELATVLDAKDPRWLRFYDRIPGDSRVPEKVEDVTATAQPGGVIAVDWGDTARAAHYKVFKQVVGVDPELVLAKTVGESDAELTGVPSGATVKLQIVAANAEGPGTPSDVIELQGA